MTLFVCSMATGSRRRISQAFPRRDGGSVCSAQIFRAGAYPDCDQHFADRGCLVQHPRERRCVDGAYGHFYRWYDRYLGGGPEALEDRPSAPSRVWNRIPAAIHDQIIELALEQSELSPRELAVQFTDEKSYFVSEASVYRLLKAHDLITSPAYVVIKAANQVHVSGGRLSLRQRSLGRASEQITVGIRPEHIGVGPSTEACLVARMQFTEQLGGETFLHCDLGQKRGKDAERIIIKLPGQRRFEKDELVGLTVRSEDIYCFDCATGAALRDQ